MSYIEFVAADIFTPIVVNIRYSVAKLWPSEPSTEPGSSLSKGWWDFTRVDGPVGMRSANLPSAGAPIAVDPYLFGRFAGKQSLRFCSENHADEDPLRCRNGDEIRASFFHPLHERFKQHVGSDGCRPEFHDRFDGYVPFVFPRGRAKSSDHDAVAVNHEGFAPTGIYGAIEHGAEQFIGPGCGDIGTGGICDALDIGCFAFGG